MSVFLTTLLLAALTQMGDRTQILAAGLSIRFANRAVVIAGCGLATAINCALAAYAGTLIRGWIDGDALVLFYALAVTFAGIAMLAWRRPVDMLENWPFGPFLTVFFGLFIVQFSDKGQFLISALVANDRSYLFAMLGGWLGVMFALVPAIVLQERLAAMLPVKAIRNVGGFGFVLTGIYYALSIWGWI
jgi:putative Ca2+/H+ antiporter (TMEM165/GDT1 family)